MKFCSSVLLLFFCSFTAFAADGPVISDLVYPELTDQDAVTIKGKLDGAAFEQRQPVAEPPGEYRLVIKAVDLSGHESSREIKIMKVKTLPRGAESWHRDPPPAPKTVSAPKQITLEGDYALILTIGDKLGHRSSQVLSVKKPDALKVIWKGRIREVWAVFKDAAGRVIRAFRVLPKKQAAITVHGSAGGHDSSALVSMGPGGAHPEDRYRPESSALVSGEKTAGAAAPSAASKPETPVKLKVPDRGERPSVPAASAAAREASKQSAEEAAKEVGFTETRVRIPDERGGMTITIDNFRTGKRLIIHRDNAGNETERSEIEVPGLRPPAKAKAAQPSTPAAS